MAMIASSRGRGFQPSRRSALALVALRILPSMGSSCRMPGSNRAINRTNQFGSWRVGTFFAAYVWRIADSGEISNSPHTGAPRIHGELLKLGIEVSQATVAKYKVRRRGTPSQNWRTFLCNQIEGIAAIDMFVVASASFRLLYAMIILAHDRRKIVRAAVTAHPTAARLSRQVTEAFPWDTAPRHLLRDRDASYSSDFCNRVEARDQGGHHSATLTVAELLR